MIPRILREVTTWRLSRKRLPSLDGPSLDEEDRGVAALLDRAGLGFFLLDEEGRFALVNERLALWLETGSATLVGTALAEVVVGENAGETRLRSRGGRLVPVRITRDQSGACGSRRAVVHDLREAQGADEALRQSRQRTRRFIANAPVGVAVLDPLGHLEEANEALAEFFGMNLADLLGKKVAGFLSPEDEAILKARLEGLAAGRVAPNGPIEVRLGGGREKSASVFLSVLGTKGAGDEGLLLHFIDTTEQKSLEVQFAQSQKMQAVGQLAGGVAHDFNNLLTAMIGFCDLLLGRFRPGDSSFADIMQIKQNANRAANLVRQLLAFSRQQALQPRILDITEVLAELSHLLRRLIGENIELKTVHGRELGLVKVDQGQLEQVIINLAVNARDAMAGGGILSIRTANITQTLPARRGLEVIPPGDYVLLEVADTGVGIPKENLGRIFEPFFSTKMAGSGTGLGLSTVYGIVKQTGGFVFVDSEPGKGATFSIYLPRHHQTRQSEGVRLEAGELAASRDLTGAGTVLLVEDEDPVRLFSARALRNKGYRVIEAKSAEAALETILKGNEKVDLVITDVVMPRMDGPGLVKEIRERIPEMKVIFISGYTEDAFRKRLDREGDIHFLPKPFSLKQLAGKVKEVMHGG